ncbi:unnamed protein product [Cylicostephanus goldi]|uniref:Major facilitator superfamily (MFS) profile domain-containing protein n=1 Tax=Cylicostephanus goldi TaxID=71465 RepID=A0A3P7PH14_CYLGO|nr:unnamed protein product [Cylicostephanus goldi]
MLGARLLTGFGAGTLSVLRAHAATASVPKDRLRAVSFGTAGYGLGLSFGPAIQAVFTPIGEYGARIGALVFNMYTVPAFFMVILSVICCFVVQFLFKEEYSVIKQEDTVIRLLISTPWSVAMYNWKDSDAVLYNGLLQTASCLVSSANSVLIGYTRIGNIEKRKQIIFGISPFYPGPLDYVPQGKNTTEIGRCLRSYDWCKDTVRVPFPIYFICFVFFFGISFPFTGSLSATLYSQTLRPRKQGIMQGIHSFGGSLAQFIAPIITT